MEVGSDEVEGSRAVLSGVRDTAGTRQPLATVQPVFPSRGSASSAPIKPDDFWQRPALRDARKARHFGQVINAYRLEHRPVLTQAKVGRWLGQTQGQVSRLERAAQPPCDLNKLDQWARALHIPERYLWFQLSQQPVCAYVRPRDAHSLDDESETGGEDVQRRQVLRVGRPVRHLPAA